MLRIKETLAEDKEVSFRRLTLIDNLLRKNGTETRKPTDSPVNPEIAEEEVKMAQALLDEGHKRYRSLVCSLFYIALKLRPNLAFAASILESYVAAPTRTIMIQAKRAMKYLRHTKEKIFKMRPGASNQLSDYVGAS